MQSTMKSVRLFLFTLFSILFFHFGNIGAQTLAANKQAQAHSRIILQPEQNPDTSLNGIQLSGSLREKMRIGIRSEFGEADPSKIQFDLGFDIAIGNWVICGDYRSYGGDAQQNHTPATPWFLLLGGWAFNGKALSTPIADLPNTLDGINEYSLTTGRVYSCLHGTILLMPSMGLAAVSRNVVHYHNCERITQPGQDIILLFPAGEDDKSWYRYTTTVESQVSITIPLSLHAVLKFASWIGLSISGWTQIGNGGTSGISAGLEIGALP